MSQYSLLPLLDDAIFSAVPALGFALVFNVPKRMLVFCALGGAFSHAFRTFLTQMGMGIEWSTLLAATCFGFIAVWLSRRYLVPRPVITVASIIPMIPGKFAFSTMIAVMQLHAKGYSELLMQQFVENGLKTLFILLALGFGLAIPSVLIYRGRHIV